MMTFYPKLGIGPIRFGMTESEVRRALTSTPHAVSQRDPIIGAWSQYYENPLMSVEFDEHDRCCAIELSHGSPLLYRGQDLASLTYRGLVDFLRGHHHLLMESDSGFRCDELCLACYSPDKGDTGTADVVAVAALTGYRENYYEDGERKIAVAGGWTPPAE